MANTNEGQFDMKPQAEMLKPSFSRFLRANTDVICELAYERREVSQNLAELESAIEADPTAVSESHKMLWRKQAEAMRAYKGVLGERIKDLIDG